MSFHSIFSKSRELWLIFLSHDQMPDSYHVLVCSLMLLRSWHHSWMLLDQPYFNHQHPLETNQFLDGLNQTLPYIQFGQPRNTRHNTPTYEISFRCLYHTPAFTVPQRLDFAHHRLAPLWVRNCLAVRLQCDFIVVADRGKFTPRVRCSRWTPHPQLLFHFA